MDIKKTISSAGRNLNTVIITTVGDDGSMDSKEIEPYAYSCKGNSEVFFCYDIANRVVRSYLLSKIISAQETRNSYTPRREINV
jgi:hypothetical protein